jgi:subtilisin family serine protease
MSMLFAWDILTKFSSVIVAVIDSGVDYSHPDIQPNIWSGLGWEVLRG